MTKYLSVLGMLLLSAPAYAETIKTKYFALELPESLPHVEKSDLMASDGRILAWKGDIYSSSYTLLIVEYTNKEATFPRQFTFEDAIQSENDEADENEVWNGKKFEKQYCTARCQAYYRETSVTENGAIFNGYEYLTKGKTTEISLIYADTQSDFKTGQELMRQLVEQLKRQEL